MVTIERLRGSEREEVLRIAAECGARNVRVFGSVARGETTESSDLDLLVDWASHVSLLDHVRMVQRLEDLLGVKVQIGTERTLHRLIRDRVLAEAKPL
ncbi:MAG: nucleotidyltransferase family protein [Acidobacteria bacterium]|nr:nucleotidyltransferase family protein [Acidobacteriota bacterium]